MLFFAKLTIIHQSIYNTCKLEDFFKAPYNVKMLFSMDHSTKVILSHCDNNDRLTAFDPGQPG